MSQRGASQAGGPGPPHSPQSASLRSSSSGPYYPWAFYPQYQYRDTVAPEPPLPGSVAGLSPSLSPSTARFLDTRSSIPLPTSTHAHLRSSPSGPLTSAPAHIALSPGPPSAAPSPKLAPNKRFMEFSEFSLQPAEKDSHTTKEKRRRQSVNAHYTELRAMLPPISENKAAVLHHAIEHVRRMSQSCAVLMDQNNVLAERNQQLQAQILELQEMLTKNPAMPAGPRASPPAAAPPASSAPSNDAEQGRRRTAGSAVSASPR